MYSSFQNVWKSFAIDTVKKIEILFNFTVYILFQLFEVSESVLSNSLFPTSH